MTLRHIILLGLLLLSLPALAKQEQGDVDYLSLAAMLIKDGHYERAEAALVKLELADQAGEEVIEDRARFYTLKGLVLLKKQDFASAKQALLQAIDEGQTESVAYVYLAQAAYGDQDYQTTLDAIENAGQVIVTMQGLYTIKAQSHWKLNEKNQAWETLLEGLQYFPDEATFLRQQVFFLMELRLYQDAVEVGNKYLSHANAGVEDYLAIGSALRKSKQPDNAIEILERAKILYPSDVRVIIELAHSYLDIDHALAAAELFLLAASVDSQYMSEAAELYRRAGKLDQALSLNAQVREQEKKLKQRLAILLEYEDYELAAAMEKPLFRVGLLDDQDIRYATAYSLFKAGKFDQAAEQLNYVKRPDLFRKSTELRKVMQECQGAVWSCL